MDNTVVPNDYPELKLLCWNRDPLQPMPRDIAFGIYRREWWGIHQDLLTPKERDLIAALGAEYGTKLLGTKGQRFRNGLTGT